MSRKHVEFIQSADVDQKPWVVEGLPEGAMTRILSIDPETGYFALVRGGNPHISHRPWIPPFHSHYPWDWNKETK